MSRNKFDVSQSAVEFALVIPVLLLLIFGMLEMGHLIFVYASVLNASREAARYGAVTGIVNGNPQYQDCKGIADTATGLRFLANFTADGVTKDGVDMVQINYDQGPGTSPIDLCSTGDWTAIGTGSRIVVTITSPYSLFVPLIPIPAFNMVSTSRRTILGSISIAGTVVAPPSMSIPPSITSVNPPSGPTTGGTIVDISGLNLSGASITFATAYATCDLINATSTHITCTSPALGAGWVSVSATTIGGTAILGNAYNYVSPPTITSVSPTGGPVAVGTTVTITGTNLTNFSQVTFGGVSATDCSGTGTTQITCTTPRHDAGLVDVAVATPGGTATKTGAFTFVEPPILTVISPVTGLAAGGTSVTLTGNFLTNALLKFGTTTATSCTVTVTQIICGAPAGSGTVDVSVTTLGGTATLTNAFTYTAINRISPTAGMIAGGETVIISGTGFNSFTGVTIGGTSANSCTGTATQITCNTTAHAAGLVDVAVATPGGTTTKTNYFTYYDIPTITTVSPIGGPIAGGRTIVTITGTNLTGLSNLTFGGERTPCNINSITQITCTAPDYAPGGLLNVAVDVVATTPGGVATKTGGYTYYPMPTITSLVPSAGPLTSGAIVTINGTNLNNGKVTVTFAGTVTPSDCTLTSAILITCLAPAHAAGVVDVVDVILTNQGGSVTKTGAYTYYPAPTITTISPLYGPVSPSTPAVTITGTNLTGLSNLTFGGVSATCTVISTTQVNCTAPAHAKGVVDVVLTTPGGTATKTGGFSYTIMTITSVVPPTGKIAGGESVIVNGSNLGNFTSVTFGGVSATGCFGTTTQITCYTPQHAAGLLDVAVISPLDGTATLANAFKFVAIPTITGVSPSGGPAGTLVTITGTNLSDVTLVDFGTMPTASACTTVPSATQITCIAPGQAVGGLTVNITVTTPGGTVTSGSNERFKYP